MGHAFEHLRGYSIGEAVWQAALALYPDFECFRKCENFYAPKLTQAVGMRWWSEGTHESDVNEEFVRRIQNHLDLTGCIPGDWDEFDLFLRSLEDQATYRKAFWSRRKNLQG